MTNHNRILNVQFFEGGVEHLGLDIDRDGAVIGPVTVTVARAIEREPAETRREWPIQPRPVLARTRIAVNQNHGPAGAFDHKVQTRSVNCNEFRAGLGILMSNAGSDVALL